MGVGVNVGVMVNVGVTVNVWVAEAVAGGGESVSMDFAEDDPPHAEIRKTATPRLVSMFSSF